MSEIKRHIEDTKINIQRPGQILDYVDTREHLFDLFKYITNLETENKLLKETKLASQFPHTHCVEVKINTYKDRIDKSIDFINKVYVNEFHEMEYETSRKLLNILRGEDNATPQASSIKEAVEQDIRKKSMMDVSMNPDFFNKSYNEMKKAVSVGSKASLQAIKDGNKEFKFTVDGTEYTAKVKNKDNNSFEIIGVNDKHNRGEDNENT